MVYAAILHDVLEDTPTKEDDLFSYVAEKNEWPKFSNSLAEDK